MSKWIENVDYRLVPVQDAPDAWAVRILTGPYIETVLAYGAISFNKVKDHLSFNFMVVESPNEEAVESSKEMQDVAAELLSCIIEAGVNDGYVEFKEVKEKE